MPEELRKYSEFFTVDEGYYPEINPDSIKGDRDGWMKTIIMINPITMPIELYRYALLGVGTLNWVYYAISVAFTLAVIIFGIMVFNKVERTFMDTV